MAWQIESARHHESTFVAALLDAARGRGFADRVLVDLIAPAHVQGFQSVLAAGADSDELQWLSIARRPSSELAEFFAVLGRREIAAMAIIFTGVAIVKRFSGPATIEPRIPSGDGVAPLDELRRAATRAPTPLHTAPAPTD